MARKTERADRVESFVRGTKALAELVTRALDDSHNPKFADPGALAAALGSLPADAVASSAVVQVFMTTQIGARLELRRERLRLLECSSAVGGDDERTQFHRASGLRDAHQASTVRPPRAVSHATPHRARVRQRSQPRIEPTVIRRVAGPTTPREDEEATTLWTPEGERARVPTEAPDTVTGIRTTGRTPGSEARAATEPNDETTGYISAPRQPHEPSVVIRDPAPTTVYTGGARRDPPSTVAPEDTTEVGGRRSREPADPRRRILRPIVGFLLLMLLSATLTVALARLLS
jgi:hypothetical protein